MDLMELSDRICERLKKELGERLTSCFYVIDHEKGPSFFGSVCEIPLGLISAESQIWSKPDAVFSQAFEYFGLLSSRIVEAENFLTEFRRKFDSAMKEEVARQICTVC